LAQGVVLASLEHQIPKTWRQQQHPLAALWL